VTFLPDGEERARARVSNHEIEGPSLVTPAEAVIGRAFARLVGGSSG